MSIPITINKLPSFFLFMKVLEQLPLKRKQEEQKKN